MVLAFISGNMDQHSTTNKSALAFCMVKKNKGGRHVHVALDGKKPPRLIYGEQDTVLTKPTISSPS